MAKDTEVLSFSIVEALWIKKQIPETSLNEFERGSIIQISAERAIS